MVIYIHRRDAISLIIFVVQNLVKLFRSKSRRRDTRYDGYRPSKKEQSPDAWVLPAETVNLEMKKARDERKDLCPKFK